METALLIQKVLTTAGTALEFSTFSLQGISSAAFPLAYSEGNSVYEVAVPQFEFLVAASEVQTKGVVAGLEFAVTDQTNTLVFSCIVDNIEEDMTGWSLIKASFKQKAAI